MYSKHEKKEHARSIRMTETVKNYVESHEGNGFNEKFENLVLHCKQEEPEIDARMKAKRETIADLDHKINEKRDLLRRLENIGFNIERALAESQNIFDR